MSFQRDNLRRHFGVRSLQGMSGSLTGIVVAARGFDGRAYVLADLSGRFSPDGWARVAVGACAFCGTSFAPQRSTARFCSSRCRTAAHRSSHVCNAARARRATPGTLKPAPGISATSRLSVTRDLGPRIVADEHWRGMYRLRLSNGSLTDMTNLTRARDALANHGALNK